LPGKKPVTVQPAIGLFFTDTPPTHAPLMVKLGSKAIDIPAGQRDYAITDTSQELSHVGSVGSVGIIFIGSGTQVFYTSYTTYMCQLRKFTFSA
jgi:hypothetical protein